MFSLIFAWIAPSGDGGGGNAFLSLLPMLLIIAVIYFLMLRPQMKRQKEQKVMIDDLKKGDKVMAAGGIIGTIAGIKEKDNTLLLKVDDNVKIEVARSSVTTAIKKE